MGKGRLKEKFNFDITKDLEIDPDFTYTWWPQVSGRNEEGYTDILLPNPA